MPPPKWQQAPPVEQQPKWAQAPAAEQKESGDEGFSLSGLLGTPQEWGRAAALTGRGMVEGAAGTAGLFIDPFTAVYNMATGSEVPTTRSAYSQALTRAGVPEPETIPERINVAASDIATSTVAGSGASRAVMSRLGLAPPATTPNRQPPSTDELRQYATQAYQKADDAGVVLKPESFGSVVDDISKRVINEGIDTTLHPNASAALGRLTSAARNGQPMRFQDIEILRRVAKNAASSPRPDERRIARVIVDELDDYIDRLSADDVISGDANVASQAIRQARNLWSRMSKGEIVDDLIERAGSRAGQFSGSGFENALRTEFRQLVMNPKRLRIFNKQEQEVLKRVAQGGRIGNALRMLGKLAPTGVISGGISSGAGYAVGGPAGAVALPAAGLGSRSLATSATIRNARRAGEVMRRGASQPPPSSMNPLMPSAVGGVGGAAGSVNPLLFEDQ